MYSGILGPSDDLSIWRTHIETETTLQFYLRQCIDGYPFDQKVDRVPALKQIAYEISNCFDEDMDKNVMLTYYACELFRNVIDINKLVGLLKSAWEGAELNPHIATVANLLESQVPFLDKFSIFWLYLHETKAHHPFLQRLKSVCVQSTLCYILDTDIPLNNLPKLDSNPFASWVDHLDFGKLIVGFNAENPKFIFSIFSKLLEKKWLSIEHEAIILSSWGDSNFVYEMEIYSRIKIYIENFINNLSQSSLKQLPASEKGFHHLVSIFDFSKEYRTVFKCLKILSKKKVFQDVDLLIGLWLKLCRATLNKKKISFKIWKYADKQNLWKYIWSRPARIVYIDYLLDLYKGLNLVTQEMIHHILDHVPKSELNKHQVIQIKKLLSALYRGTELKLFEECDLFLKSHSIGLLPKKDLHEIMTRAFNGPLKRPSLVSIKKMHLFLHQYCYILGDQFTCAMLFKLLSKALDHNTKDGIAVSKELLFRIIEFNEVDLKKKQHTIIYNRAFIRAVKADPEDVTKHFPRYIGHLFSSRSPIEVIKDVSPLLRIVPCEKFIRKTLNLVLFNVKSEKEILNFLRTLFEYQEICAPSNPFILAKILQYGSISEPEDAKRIEIFLTSKEVSDKHKEQFCSSARTNLVNSQLVQKWKVFQEKLLKESDVLLLPLLIDFTRANNIFVCSQIDKAFANPKLSYEDAYLLLNRKKPKHASRFLALAEKKTSPDTINQIFTLVRSDFAAWSPYAIQLFYCLKSLYHRRFKRDLAEKVLFLFKEAESVFFSEKRKKTTHFLLDFIYHAIDCFKSNRSNTIFFHLIKDWNEIASRFKRKDSKKFENLTSSMIKALSYKKITRRVPADYEKYFYILLSLNLRPRTFNLFIHFFVINSFNLKLALILQRKGYDCPKPSLLLYQLISSTDDDLILEGVKFLNTVSSLSDLKRVELFLKACERLHDESLKKEIILSTFTSLMTSSNKSANYLLKKNNREKLKLLIPCIIHFIFDHKTSLDSFTILSNFKSLTKNKLLSTNNRTLRNAHNLIFDRMYCGCFNMHDADNCIESQIKVNLGKLEKIIAKLSGELVEVANQPSSQKFLCLLALITPDIHQISETREIIKFELLLTVLRECFSFSEWEKLSENDRHEHLTLTFLYLKNYFTYSHIYFSEMDSLFLLYCARLTKYNDPIFKENTINFIDTLNSKIKIPLERKTVLRIMLSLFIGNYTLEETFRVFSELVFFNTNLLFNYIDVLINIVELNNANINKLKIIDTCIQSALIKEFSEGGLYAAVNYLLKLLSLLEKNIPLTNWKLDTFYLFSLSAISPCLKTHEDTQFFQEQFEPLFKRLKIDYPNFYRYIIKFSEYFREKSPFFNYLLKIL